MFQPSCTRDKSTVPLGPNSAARTEGSLPVSQGRLEVSCSSGMARIFFPAETADGKERRQV